MFRNRTLNNTINGIRDNAFRIVYCDRTSKLLRKDNKMIVDQRNLQAATTEFYKVKIHIAPNLIKELFPLRMHAYNLRFSYELEMENVKTVHYGTEFSWKLLSIRNQILPNFIRIFLKKLNLGSQKIVLAGSVKLTYIK